MDRDQWLAERRTGIGGSDVAAILGMSRWRTPLEVYLDKIGELPAAEESEPMRWGRALEPIILRAYAEQTGFEVRSAGGMPRHPVHQHMLANLDGLVGSPTAQRRIVEAKTARSADGWGEPGTDEVPQEYLLQVQHYMEVTGIPVADVAVLIGGSDFRIYTVAEDHDLQQMLIEAEAEFWARVQRRDPPPPRTLADAQALYGRKSRAASVVASADVEQAVAALRELRARGKEIDAAIEQCQAAILAALGEADTLIDPACRVLATWKTTAAPQRFDAAAFKAAHPELHAQYLKTGAPARRFLLKGE